MDFCINPERLPEGIQKLKNENSIYLYGISDYALFILKRLREFSISVKGVQVSPGYKDRDTFEGLNVWEYGKSECREKYVVVAGFDILKHCGLVDTLVADENVECIYVLDGVNKYVRNNFSFIDSKIYFVDNYYETFLKRNLDYAFFIENKTNFMQTYNWLSDDLSKKVMEQYLRGHIEVTDFPMKDLMRREDAYNQYFPENIFTWNNKEVVIDCGAYTGDTLQDFKSRISSFERYYALEPDKTVIEELKEVMAECEENVIHIPWGAWDRKEVLFFKTETGSSAISRTSTDVSIEVDAIDNMIDKKENVTFVKMDIEGSELKALLGAKEMLQRCKPKLAICVYHRREDLISIPQYIKSISDRYKIFLRPHRAYIGEVVLYAVCD